MLSKHLPSPARLLGQRCFTHYLCNQTWPRTEYHLTLFRPHSLRYSNPAYTNGSISDSRGKVIPT